MKQFDAEAHAACIEASFDQMYPVFAALRRHRPRLVADYERILREARRFRREVIEPNALAIERQIMRDPTWVAEDALRAAARYGWFSMMIPKMFGGQGLSFGAMMVGIEEMAAGCLGLANLFAVHGLAVSTVAATGDVQGMEKVSRLLAESEKQGCPALLSTAITEPGAGSDVEDVDLLPGARLQCEATPVRGGYRLNGRKVFISNGSIARIHVVIMPTDRRRPVDTTFAFLVETGTPGLRIGRVERKMGQKACPAAELVFEDCFVPESSRLHSKPLPGRRIELVLGATRGGVAVFGAGVARGAYERALAYARTHALGGRWLIDQQWVQMRLSDMLRNVMLARASYVDAMLSNELFGLSALASSGTANEISRLLPQALFDARAVRRVVVSRRTQQMLQSSIEGLPTYQVDTASAFGAASKVSATDLGIESCHMALDIMGADGLRHDQGVEKLYRDAKLLQIYEGTNQINRIELYKRGVNRAATHAAKRPEPALERSAESLAAEPQPST
ncbi:MAG: acyl-CoA/acyl-ACP dehydrogenase [Polyangiaceae bacterium]|nr:acyl-CoA/acyl-ACP dehydrogenase [Polyangiaceae bacterium]